MEFILVETLVRVKEEHADTNYRGQGQIDLSSDWKLDRNVECRVTLERMDNISSKILPSIESHVRWSPPPQMDKGQDERNHRMEHIEEFIRSPFQTQTLSTGHEIDIKYEGNWIENNSTSNAENLYLDLDPGPDIISSNIESECPVYTEKTELSEFYRRLLQCELDCETCQKYIRELSEHVRATHTTCQPARDPLLLIDTLDMDQSSAIEIKCEDSEVIEKVDYYCHEFKPEPDLDIESGSESDPDYVTTSHYSRKVRLPNSDLSPHISSDYSGDKRYNCEERGKGFSGNETLTVHKRIHTGKKGSKMPFKCTDCGKGHSTKSRLTSHMRRHTGERPFKCTLCPKSFSQKGNFDLHIRKHTGVKPFKCSLCAKSFVQKGNLIIHMRSHTGEKPFKCTLCAKSFSQKCNLDSHMRVHAGEKPFKCAECDKNFTQMVHLSRHMRCHTGNTP